MPVTYYHEPDVIDLSVSEPVYWNAEHDESVFCPSDDDTVDLDSNRQLVSDTTTTSEEEQDDDSFREMLNLMGRSHVPGHRRNRPTRATTVYIISHPEDAFLLKKSPSFIKYPYLCECRVYGHHSFTRLNRELKRGNLLAVKVQCQQAEGDQHSLCVYDMRIILAEPHDSDPVFPTHYPCEILFAYRQVWAFFEMIVGAAFAISYDECVSGERPIFRF